MTILQTSIAFTLSSTQIIGAITAALSVIFGGAASAWKVFNRVSQVESEVEQNQRVNTILFNLFTNRLDAVSIDGREARENTIAIMAKLEIPRTFDRSLYERQHEAERRETKERLKQAEKGKST